MIRVLKILLLLPLLNLGEIMAQGRGEVFTPSSVLASGNWFRIGVTTEGVCRIDYSRLAQLGIDNPSSPAIYGNNHGQLSYFNNDPKPDDLREIAIYMEKGSDGVFNQGDYLLFYAKGTHRWIYDESSGEYDYLRHNYSDTAWYFITSKPEQGRLITEAEVPDEPPDFISEACDALFIHEKETENILKSGREWYQPAGPSGILAINPGFTDILTNEEVRYVVRVLARAPVQTSFSLYEGDNLCETIYVQPVNLSASTGTYAQTAMVSGIKLPSSSSPRYELKYSGNGEQGARAWIDNVRLHARKNSFFDGNITHISDSRSVAGGRITEFNIAGNSTGAFVWDVTDPHEVRKIKYTESGGIIRFRSPTDSLRTYVIFNPAKAPPAVIQTERVKNQDLHASPPADMIIVTHPLFLDYAARLADIHFRNSGLISQIVTPGEIYNEYSGGIPDLVAIRNYVRMKWLKQMETSQPLKYLLLFGDGSYENKTPPPANPNFIPTWQSKNSNVVISSFTSDDFYGLLEDDEGEEYGTEDIGIGRLPVSDTIQAGIIVSKIDSYLNHSDRDDWKNIISLVADDEDGNSHMNDAEGLAALISSKYPSFNIDKIYLDAYRQVTSATGQTYPDVNRAISDRINSGCLILNYTGHGNEIGLAHERVVRPEDILSWKNSRRLPLFITATCEFSRFDDTDYNYVTGIRTGRNSAGEVLLLRKDGGAVALMSTTRVAYSAPNYFLNRNIYDAAFEYDEEGKPLRLGDIIRIAKNNTGSGTNKRNFLLLGDPALRLTFPWHGNVLTDSINSVHVSEQTDTLKALSLITLSGHVETISGQADDSFNGTLCVVVYDKEETRKTMANDGGPVMEFGVRNNIIFSGKTTVSEGRFRFTFIVPRDIDYSYGEAKISYYAFDENIDMHGSFNDITAGGFSNHSSTDTRGPVIRLFLNDTLFRHGGITDDSPRLLAIIEDESGINSTGSGIGHDITAYLDGNMNNPVNLNGHFTNDIDSYKKGMAVYPFYGLSEGAHTVTVKAWDNFNNSSEETILFVVKSDQGFVLTNLINYPNPFSGHTNITADHNRPGENLYVTVTIYNSAGNVIRILKKRMIADGYRLPPLTWDGNDGNGSRAGRGVYIFRAEVMSESAQTAVLSGRMIIL